MAELHPKNDEAAEIVVGELKCDGGYSTKVPSGFEEIGVFGDQEWHDCEHGKYRPHTYYPDMRTPAMVVKMIEWLAKDRDIDLNVFYFKGVWTIGFSDDAPDFDAPILADALILAIISTKESTNGKD